MECVEGHRTIESGDSWKGGNETKKITHLEYRRPPTDNNPHNIQVKIGGRGGGDMRGGSTRGDCMEDLCHHFGGNNDQ